MATPSAATPDAGDDVFTQVMDAQSELPPQADAQINAKRDVILAELKQEDLFTRRARPSVVYAGIGFIFVNYVLLPAIFVLAGREMKDGALTLPEEFWWTWGSLVGTWSIGRTFEKNGAAGRALSAITGSGAGAGKTSPDDGAVG